MANATRGFFHPDFLQRESLSGLRREKNQQQSPVRLNQLKSLMTSTTELRR